MEFAIFPTRMIGERMSVDEKCTSERHARVIEFPMEYAVKLTQKANIRT